MRIDAAARKYAAALYAAIGLDAAQRVQTLLEDMAREAGAHKVLGDVLRHPLIGADVKRRVLERLFGPPGPGGEALTPEVSAFLQTLFSRGRGGELPAAAEALQEIIDEAVHHHRGEVTSAVALSEAQTARLAGALATRLGGTVSLTRRVDPDVLGGLGIRIGGRRLDLTLRRRLDGMRRALGAGVKG